MRTTKQRAASRRNLVKARAARKGSVTLYHRTTPEHAKSIITQQKFISKHPSGLVFFSGERVDRGNGPAGVTVTIPRSKVKRTSLIKSGTARYSTYTVSQKDLTGIKIRKIKK